MKKIISISIICVFVFSNTSCFVQSKKYREVETKKVEECRRKWIYKDLENVKEVTVLLFSEKFNYDLSTFPNFLIVRTLENDTIAFLDKEFDDNIKVGSKIKLLPFHWNEVEKAIMKPAFIVQKREKDNELYCHVQGIYYGKLEIKGAVH